MTESDFVGKTIKEISVDGFGIEITTEDDLHFCYAASDGGYSSWDIEKGDLISD